MHDINKELEKFFQLLEEAESSTPDTSASPAGRSQATHNPDRNPSPPASETERPAEPVRPAAAPVGQNRGTNPPSSVTRPTSSETPAADTNGAPGPARRPVAPERPRQTSPASRVNRTPENGSRPSTTERRENRRETPPTRPVVPPAGKVREFPSTARIDQQDENSHSNLDQLMQEVRGKLNQPARPRQGGSAIPIPNVGSSSAPQSIVVEAPEQSAVAATPTWRRGVLTGLAIVLPACLALAIILNRPSGDFEIDASSAIAQNSLVLSDGQAELSMTSAPSGARIFLDGELFGVTPFESVRIKPGTYQVTAELPGYSSIDTMLTVRARHWITLNIPGSDQDQFFAGDAASGDNHILAGLESSEGDDGSADEASDVPAAREETRTEPASESRTTERRNRPAPRPTTGTIVFTSEPTGATVFLDNRERGQTPLTLNNVPGGSHSVKYTLEGYEDYALGLELTPGIQTPLHTSLQPAFGTITLDVQSTGSVFIDGTRVDTDVTGSRSYELTPGTHTIAVQRAGLAPWELNVNVKAGEAQTIVAEAPDSEFAIAYREAETMYAQGEYQAARDLFEKAQTLQPSNRLVVGKLAEIDRLLEAERTQELTEAIIENGVYLITDTPPKLVGGLEELHKQVKYPEAAYQAGVTGRVYIQFVVNEDGSASDFVVTKGLPLGCNEEAIRAIQSARFEPATFDGRTVKARHTLFVNFGQK